MFTVLLICTGNIARSPIAEVLFARGLRERLKDGAEDLYVHSAGTLGLIGEPIAGPARELLLGGLGDPGLREPEGSGFAGYDVLPGARLPGFGSYGADPVREHVEAFRARRLEPELLAGADLVLGATREHRAAAVGMAPQLVRRAFTLVELARLAGAAAHAVLAEGDGIEPPPAVRARAVVARACELRASVRALHVADDDIEDPYGRDPSAYRRVGDRIAAAVEAVLDGLVGR